MQRQSACRFCGGKRFWKVRRNSLKCKRCRRETTQHLGSIYLPRQKWHQIIHWFVLEQSTNRIQEQTNVSKYHILKVLLILRRQTLKDVPEIFSGIVEVDETYLGGQMKNRRKKVKLLLGRNRRGFGTVKQPVFGILCREGRVYAEIVPDIEAQDLQPLIEKQVRRGSTICADTWRGYTGLAAKGYVHRLVRQSENQDTDQEGHHIKGPEGFWGYLKRKLAAKGGVRKSRLYLYLGEYVWRYNHRHLSVKEQTDRLINLVEDI